MSYIKTLIITRCYPSELDDLDCVYPDLENLILVTVVVNSSNCKINNLPITLKSLIIAEVIGSDATIAKFYNNIKLPFCTELIKGRLTSYSKYGHLEKTLYFEYINNCHNFYFETAITYNYFSSTCPCIIHKQNGTNIYYINL